MVVEGPQRRTLFGTPKKDAAYHIFEESKVSASSEMCSAHPLVPATFYLIKSERWSFEAPATRSQ